MIINLQSSQLDLEFKVNSKNLKTLEDVGKKLLKQLGLPLNIQFNIQYNKINQKLEELIIHKHFEINFTLPIKITLIFSNREEDIIQLDAFQSISELSKQIREKHKNIIMDYTIEFYHYGQGNLLNQNFLFAQEFILSDTSIKYQICSELMIEFEEKQYQLKVKNVFQQFGTLVEAMKSLFSITSIINVKYKNQNLDFTQLFYKLKLPKNAKLVVEIPEFVQFQIIDQYTEKQNIININQELKVNDLLDKIRVQFSYGRQFLKLTANQIDLNVEDQICSYNLLYMQQIYVTQIQKQINDQTSSEDTLTHGSDQLFRFFNQMTRKTTEKKFDSAYQIGIALQEIEQNCKYFQITYNGEQISQYLSFQQQGIDNFSEINYTCLDLRLFYEIQNQQKSTMVNDQWNFYQIEQYIKSQLKDEISEEYTIVFENNSNFYKKTPRELCFREFSQKLIFKKKQYDIVILVNYPAKKQYQKFQKKFDQKIDFVSIEEIVKKSIQYKDQSLQYQIGYKVINEEEFLQQIQISQNIIVNVFEKIPITIKGQQTNQQFKVEICPITPFMKQLHLLRVEKNHKLYYNDQELDYSQTCQNYGITADSILQCFTKN